MKIVDDRISNELTRKPFADLVGLMLKILPSGNRSSKKTSLLTMWVTKNNDSNLTKNIILGWINVSTFNKPILRQIGNNSTDTLRSSTVSKYLRWTITRKMNSQAITFGRIVFQAKWKALIGQRWPTNSTNSSPTRKMAADGRNKKFFRNCSAKTIGRNDNRSNFGKTVKIEENAHFCWW